METISIQGASKPIITANSFAVCAKCDTYLQNFEMHVVPCCKANFVYQLLQDLQKFTEGCLLQCLEKLNLAQAYKHS